MYKQRTSWGIRSTGFGTLWPEQVAVFAQFMRPARRSQWKPGDTNRIHPDLETDRNRHDRDSRANCIATGHLPVPSSASDTIKISEGFCVMPEEPLRNMIADNKWPSHLLKLRLDCTAAQCYRTVFLVMINHNEAVSSK